MANKRPRKLRKDERELWTQFTTGVTARQRATPVPDPLPSEEPKAKVPVPAFKIGETVSPRSSAALTRSHGVKTAPNMDGKMFGRMKKGQLAPEARLDLHGMTAAEAHGALAEFIFKAHGKGLRLVLVITGKGNPKNIGLMPVERGILRRQTPEWLRLAPLGPLVLDVTPAHRRHGGDGALYVYLRRRR